MPIYEYRCGSCSHELEALQKISDSPLRKCPECGKLTLRRLISAPVFRLKGAGWYETDFKGDKENKRNLAGADKEEPKTEAKSDAKADAKADAKPEAAKPEAAKSEKSEPAKPAVEKASRGASKTAAKRAKPKSKPARKARR